MTANRYRPIKRQGAKQEGAWKTLLRVDDFSSAVRAKLPAFVGPQHADHSKSKRGEKAKSRE